MQLLLIGYILLPWGVGFEYKYMAWNVWLGPLYVWFGAYDYNCTNSGLNFVNSTDNTIYLGLVWLTLVFLKCVTFIWNLVFDYRRVKMGGTVTFNYVSTMKKQFFLSKQTGMI